MRKRKRPAFEIGDRVRSRPIGLRGAFVGTIKDHLRDDWWLVTDDNGMDWLRSDEELLRVKGSE